MKTGASWRSVIYAGWLLYYIVDLNISQKESGVVLRKDLLDAFLKKNNLKLIWFVRASKELHSGENLGILRYGDRSGAYFYNGAEIASNIYIVEQR